MPCSQHNFLTQKQGRLTHPSKEKDFLAKQLKEMCSGSPSLKISFGERVVIDIT
jgi:hypothetical protein